MFLYMFGYVLPHRACRIERALSCSALSDKITRVAIREVERS